jgi:DNA-binding IclR family transcriptional regulator
MECKAINRESNNQPYDKVLSVLEAVASWAQPMSISEIAQQTGLRVPTVHRLTSQLEHRGFLKRQIAGKKYLVGHALIRLGAKALNAGLLTDNIRAELTNLARKIGEHCQLGVNHLDEITYVETARAELSSGLFFAQGRRSPLHCSSIGKLYLSELSVEDFERWLGRASLSKLTKNTITSVRALKKEIRDTRRRGWSSSDEELVEGVVGCAVPICDSAGRVLAGLGVSAPKARIAFNELARLIPSMELAATRIAALLDDRKPSQ